MRRTGGGHDTLLGQMGAQRIDRLCALPNQKVSGPIGHRRRQLRLALHIDKTHGRPLRCHPRGDGKLERHVRDLRATVDPKREAFDRLEHPQSFTDARLDDLVARLRCAITCTSVATASDEERRLLAALPETLPETFDVVVRRPVGIDCMINFEVGRRLAFHPPQPTAAPGHSHLVKLGVA